MDPPLDVHRVTEMIKITRCKENVIVYLGRNKIKQAKMLDMNYEIILQSLLSFMNS